MNHMIRYMKLMSRYHKYMRRVSAEKAVDLPIYHSH